MQRIRRLGGNRQYLFESEYSWTEQRPQAAATVSSISRRRTTRAEAPNPPGSPVGSRHRQQLNGEFIAALLRDFRHGGPKAIERVRRTQPAAYLKILAL